MEIWQMPDDAWQRWLNRPSRDAYSPEHKQQYLSVLAGAFGRCRTRADLERLAGLIKTDMDRYPLLWCDRTLATARSFCDTTLERIDNDDGTRTS